MRCVELLRQLSSLSEAIDFIRKESKIIFNRAYVIPTAVEGSPSTKTNPSALGDPSTAVGMTE